MSKSYPARQFEVRKPISVRDYGLGTVIAVLHFINGNSAPYFSVTCDFKDAGGCMHDVVLKYCPELKPVVDLHLSDHNGVPMHAHANARYFAGFCDGMADVVNVEHLANHLRCSIAQAQELIDSDAETLKEYIDAQFPRWKAEADYAIKLLQSMGGK